MSAIPIPTYFRYRMVESPGHPLANARGEVSEHRAVLYERIGPGLHKCHWCDRNVYWSKRSRKHNPEMLVADHLDGDQGNNEGTNLVPSCDGCNLKRQVPRRLNTSSHVTVECPQCNAKFPTPTTVRGVPYRKYCSKRCAVMAQWKSGALTPQKPKETIVSYRSITIHGHPLAHENGCVSVHRAVLYEKIGPGEHACHWCGAPVAWKATATHKALVSDHVDNYRHNNDPDNLVPSCVGCNSMRGMGMSRIMPGEIYSVNNRGGRARAEQRICESCSTSFPCTNKNPKWGRFCSKRCRWDHAKNNPGSVSFKKQPKLKHGELFLTRGDHRLRLQGHVCSGCGADFMAPASDKRKYCHQSCYKSSRVKVA